MIQQDVVLKGRYRLHHALYEDSDIIAYEATDEQQNRPVLVKLVRPERAQDRVLLNGLRAGVTRARRVNHPALVPVYDADLTGSQPYLVEPRIEARSLAERVSAGQTLAWDEVVPIGIAAAQALGVAHRAGLVHGAIGPRTILMADDGTVYLSDLGLPGGAPVDIDRARFVAPEQLEGHAPTTRSDVYSLASVLYWLFTGAAPYEAADAASVVRLKRTTEPASLRELRPDLPGDLMLVMDEALSRDPRQRSANGTVFADRLAHGPRPVATTVERRPLWPYIVGTVLGLLLLGLIGWLLFTTPVPNVVGVPEAQARQSIIDHDLVPTVGGFVVANGMNRNDVASQAPAAGSRIRRGSMVSLYLTGPDRTTTPSLIGLTETEAQDRLLSAGLRLGLITYSNDPNSAVGVVVTQSPLPQQDVALNTQVALVVNRPTGAATTVVPPPPPTVIVPQAVPVPTPANPPAVTPPPANQTTVVPVPVPVPQGGGTQVVPQPYPVPVPVPGNTGGGNGGGTTINNNAGAGTGTGTTARPPTGTTGGTTNGNAGTGTGTAGSTPGGAPNTNGPNGGLAPGTPGVQNDWSANNGSAGTNTGAVSNGAPGGGTATP